MASRYVRCSLVVVFLAIAFYAFSPPVVHGEVTVKENDSVVCTFVGWLVKPLGFCAPEVTSLSKEVPLVGEEDENVFGSSYANFSELIPPTPEIAGASTSVVYETNYITVSGQGVSQEELTSRLHKLILYVNLRDQLTKSTRVSEEAYEDGDLRNPLSLVTKDYLWKSLDSVNERISDIDGGGGTTNNITNNYSTTTNATGDIFADTVSLGTTTNLAQLTLSEDIFLDDFTPGTTLNRLYNSGGTLYWNGTSITGSSTGSNWAESGADVYRISGNVGIGTSTPQAELTVVGDIAATSIKAQLLDMGGHVCNVEAYGAVGDNVTINDAAIAAAIDDCDDDGGTVLFPMGQFRISTPIVLDEPVTLMGTYAPRWSYASTPRSSIRADFGTFTGTALVHVRDQSISGAASANNGGRLMNLSIDGGSYGADIHGIYFEGLVRDWKVVDVDISQTTGDGFLAEVGSGSGNPRGFTIRGLSIYSAGAHGFRATALNDSYIEDLLAVGNALRGIYLSSMGETKINNSRAVFNALEGLYIDGASSNGGLMFTDFSTDRNDRHGVRISSTGTTTITFNGLLTRRDGANDGGGTETPYAGVGVIGTSSTKVAPVIINGLSQIVGVDDDGTGTQAPAVGVRVVNAEYVRVNGQLWGISNAYVDGGGNGWFIIEDDSIIKTGNEWSNQTPPLYASKWVATTSGLLYASGTVTIGATPTTTRLFNIVNANSPGARFTDTTNNVMFDMRAEDSQAFFGTFSNHQIRFQTNNTSRMTIDTNGRVGISTTSPSHLLTVAGDMNVTGAFRATGDAGTTGMVLQTTGSGVSWVATSSLGISGQSLSLGTDNQIPFVNSGGTDLEYSSNLAFDGSNLGLGSTQGIAFGGTRMFHASTSLGTIALGETAGASFGSNTLHNIAIGYQAAQFSSSTDDNNYGTFMGYQAGRYSAGDYVVAIGWGAGYASENRISNIIGSGAGYSSVGERNNLIGPDAGNNSQSIASNMIGNYVGFNSIGDQNNLIGDATGYNNSGYYNNMIGISAGHTNSGNSNNFMGSYVGQYNTGNDNVFIGSGTAQYNVGNGNIFLGYAGGQRNFGNNNIGFGTYTLGSSTGSSNYAIGDDAGRYVVGSNNLFFGYHAADNLTSGSNNIVIGHNIDLISATSSNLLNIGNLIFGTAIDGTGTTLSSGNIGIGNSNPQQKLTIGDGSATGAQWFRNQGDVSDIMIGQGAFTLFGVNPASTSFLVQNSERDFALTIGNVNNQPLIFGTSNIERMRIHASGNISISTTSEYADLTVGGHGVFTGTVGIGNVSPSTALEVGNGTAIGSQWMRTHGSVADIYIGQSNGSIFGLSTTSTAFILQDAGRNSALAIGNANAQPLIFATDNAERMRIEADGDVTFENEVSVDEALSLGSGLSFTDGDTVTFMTPRNTGVPTKINVPLFDPPAFGQVMAMGLASSATSTARVLSLLDDRRSAHQPTIGIFSPDENNLVGFSWDGSDTTSYLKTTGGNIGIRSNATDIATFMGTGNVGIGTTTPSHLFTVAGDMNLTGALRTNGSAGTTGMVLQTTGSGTQWVATSTLGIGNGTYLGLSDTPDTFTANRIPFTNTGATALSDSADFTFDGTNLGLGAQQGIAWAGTRYLYASSTNDSITFGESAGAALLSDGIENVLIGRQAGRLISTGDLNVAIGNSTLENGTSSERNVAIGFEALQALTGGWNNVAVGYKAGETLTIGGQNVAIGSFALSSGTSTAFNTAVGYGALGGAIDATYNVAMGHNSANDLQIGIRNVFSGYAAAQNATSASDSVIIGFQAGQGDGATNLTWDGNTIIGFRAGRSINGSENNVLLGFQAADNLTSGSNNVVIGYNVDIASTTRSNQLNIGNILFGTGIDGTGTTLSSGNIGIGTTTPGSKLDVWGGVRIGTSSPFLTVDSTTGYVGVASSSPTYQFSVQGTAYISGNTRTSQFIDSDNSSYFLNPSAATSGALAGNLGVGTTSPAARLDVWGSLLVSTSSTPLLVASPATNGIGVGTTSTRYLLNVGDANLMMRFNNSITESNDPYGLNFDTAANSARRFTLSTEEGTNRSALQFGDSANATQSIFGIARSANSGADWSQHFVVQAGGNIGIGTSTPSSKLDVYSDTAQDALKIRTDDGSNWSFNQYGSLYHDLSGMMMGYLTYDAINTWGYTSGQDTYISSGGWGGAQDIILLPGGGGNVGVGTTTPSSKFSLSQSADSSGLRISGFDNESNEGAHMFVDSNGIFNIDIHGPTGAGYLSGGGAPVAAWNGSAFIMADNKELAFGNDLDVSMGVDNGEGTFKIVLGNDVATSTGHMMTFTGNKFIGIGTTTPTAQLTTTGTVRFDNFGAGTLQTDADGNLSVSSDERLKDILGMYEAGLDEILLINPIRYHWNEESGFEMESEYAGFSAQNVQAALPAAVNEDKHGFLTLSDRSILAAVVNAIKELYTIVTGNQEKIAELEERLEALEAEQGAPAPTPQPQSTSQPEPESEPTPEPVPTPEPEPTPAPESIPEPTPEPEPAPEEGPEPEPETEPTPEAEPEPEVALEPEPAV